MRERRDDRQLHLSLQSKHSERSSNAGVSKDARPIVDLNNVRASRHGSNVLERVIREGFTKKK